MAVLVWRVWSKGNGRSRRLIKGLYLLGLIPIFKQVRYTYHRD